MQTKIIISDGHSLIRSGLSSYLRSEGFDVVAQAESFVELIDVIKTQPAHIVLADCSMVGAGPVNFMHLVRRSHSELRVFFLTGLNSPLLFKQLLAMGVSGLISKADGMTEVLNALNLSEASHQYISPSLDVGTNAPEVILSSKEFQLLELILQGKSNNQMAEMLNKAPGTINTHRANIMKKLNVNSVVELVVFCKANGFWETKTQ